MLIVMLFVFKLLLSALPLHLHCNGNIRSMRAETVLERKKYPSSSASSPSFVCLLVRRNERIQWPALNGISYPSGNNVHFYTHTKRHKAGMKLFMLRCDDPFGISGNFFDVYRSEIKKRFDAFGIIINFWRYWRVMSFDGFLLTLECLNRHHILLRPALYNVRNRLIEWLFSHDISNTVNKNALLLTAMRLLP